MVCPIGETDCPLCINGVTAEMFPAVITQYSKAVYDMGRHYRAAECLSQLYRHRQIREVGQWLTWQHLNGVVSKSASSSKITLSHVEYPLVMVCFHCPLEAFQKLCLQ